VDCFINKGYEVVVVDNLSTGKRENINSKAKFYNVDIQNPLLEDVFDKERPDFVDHHAAQICVSKSIREPLFDAQVNILGSLNLIKCSKKYNVKKFIYASTGGAIYGEPTYLPCDETYPVEALSPYGVSKHTVEHYLYLYYRNYDLDYKVLRYSNIYGPRQDPYGEAGVIAIFAERMLKNDKVIINGDGDQERDFLYVSDVVKANLLSIEDFSHLPVRTKKISKEKKFGDFIYNLGTGKGISVNRIFMMLKEITHYKLDPLYVPSKTGEVYKISLNAEKAKRELGWEPTVYSSEGLKKTVKWFKKASLKFNNQL